jgi:hypothetical protein
MSLGLNKPPNHALDRITRSQLWLAVALMFGLLIAGCSYNGHQVTGEFTAMPPNDAALQEWLKTQPTVSTPSIRIVRKESKVTVIFKTSSHRLDPETLRVQFTKLGYLGGTITFERCNIKP